MSEGKDIYLNVKRLTKKVMVQHSTPMEVSTLSKNILPLGSVLNSSAYLSPVPRKLFEPELSFEEQPLQHKTRSSWGLLHKRLSVMSFPPEEPSSSSQFTIPRRRLSTIIGSEESAEELLQTLVLPVTSSKRSGDPVDLHRKSRKGTTQQKVSNQLEATNLKEMKVKRKKNGKIAKKIVEKKVKEWELRQLKNIEEATTHELTIEEV